MRCVLGIDTSCYTTSVALFSEDGRLISDSRRLLEVKSGGRGLAQSEMVYQHTRHFPDVLVKAITEAVSEIKITRIGVTTMPRPVADSFMPAFLVGDSFAKVLSVTHQAKCCPLSHQENHILAGLWSAGGPKTTRFLAVHVSGGTTEVAEVTYNQPNMTVNLIGGSSDIAAGQFVDRIGVALGLAFPAGPKLELLAKAAQNAPTLLPVAARQLSISFAGPESHARRLMDKGESPAAIAAGVQLCVAKTLAKLISAAMDRTGLTDILLVGGVGSNLFIRDFLIKKLAIVGGSLYFPEPQFSSDNAVGAAWFALNN
ncbi:MAG: tsaD 2 [Firmicutes bacterium]|nr:tsaD 2 [Bacillota bacterium]